MITGGIIKKSLGLSEGKLVGLAKKAANTLVDRGGHTDGDALGMLKVVIANPKDYTGQDANYPEVIEFAKALLPAAAPVTPPLRATRLPYYIWGNEHIEQGAFDQMDVAMRLPVAVDGALMPDAHPGYGLPVGGVLAADNAVIPYAVGVDIGCRMRLTVIGSDAAIFNRPEHYAALSAELRLNTYFGVGVTGVRPDHAIMDDPRWNELPLLRNLKDKAWAQLGTSGSGNHFVEWGEIEVLEKTSVLAWPVGTKLLTLLSHSGSRGAGAAVAKHYTDLAMKLRRGLDQKAKHLAWLTLDEAEGQEYWLAMNLMGDYAKANHEVIHDAVIGGVGVAVIENHHNFAWKEVYNGQEVIVHRKGATPAGWGVLGVIPGSMADPGYVVRGKGRHIALNSASHGAGRVGSRTEARNTISARMQDEYLRERGVELLAGGRDEAPQAYKNIEQVMNAQDDLVDRLARFQPRIVMMSEETKDE